MPVPEWGGTVYVREMTGDERDAFDQILFESQRVGEDAGRDWRGIRAKTIAMCLCDEAGNSMQWSELDIARLGKKGAGPLERLWDLIRVLSGIEESDEPAKNDEAPPETSG